MRKWLIFLAGPALLILSGCGGAAPAPTAAPPTQASSTEPAAPPTNTPLPAQAEAIAEPTAAGEQATVAPTEPAAAQEPEATTPPEPAPPAAEVDWLTVEGKTADDFTYLGNPDAPVTIIDYSDFL